MIRELFESLLTRIEAGTIKPATEAIPYDPTHAVVTARRTGPGAYEILNLPQGKPERPPRLHAFHDVESFAAYVKKHMPDAGSAEILAGQSKMTAINAASWAHDEVSCLLPWHPDLVAWEAVFKREYPQAGLYKALALVAHTIVPASDKATTLLTQLQSLKVDATGSTAVTLSEHGMYTLRSESGTASLTTPLDSTVLVECPIYLDDLGKRRFGVRLSVNNENPSRILFALSPVDLDVVKRDAYRDQVRKLRGLLGDDYLVGMGDLALGT